VGKTDVLQIGDFIRRLLLIWHVESYLIPKILEIAFTYAWLICIAWLTARGIWTCFSFAMETLPICWWGKIKDQLSKVQLYLDL